MAVQTVTQVGAAPASNSNDLRLDTTSLLYQLTAVANDVAALASACKTLVNTLRTRAIGTGLITAPTLAIGSTDKNIANTAFTFHINGVGYAKAAVTAGTAIGAQTVPADKWALYRLSIATSGTITVTPAAGNATGYDTEALAIAAIPATPASEVDMGYVTVLTKAATQWIANTDALAGGASGNPATTTNYYPASATVGAAVSAGDSDTIAYSTGVTP